MCLMLDQFLWGHSSRVGDISCFMTGFALICTRACYGVDGGQLKGLVGPALPKSYVD